MSVCPPGCTKVELLSRRQNKDFTVFLPLCVLTIRTYVYYHPNTKLRGSDVFTSVCLSVHGEGLGMLGCLIPGPFPEYTRGGEYTGGGYTKGVGWDTRKRGGMGIPGGGEGLGMPGIPTPDGTPPGTDI